MLKHWSIWPTIAGLIIGTALYFSVPGHADPAENLALSVCAAIENNPTADTVSKIGTILMGHGLTPREAASLVVASVETYCPAYMPVLAAASGGAAAGTTV
jgi:hypothetical protein